MRLIPMAKSAIITSITIFLSSSLLIWTVKPKQLGLYNESSERTLRKGKFESIYNSTLGFEKIVFINLPESFDRDDAILMQSMVTGLTIDPIDTVSAADINKVGKGLPPSSRSKDLEPMRLAHKACSRSHANAWKKMLREGWNTMLVLESDAAWDENIKEITHRAADAFYQFRLGSTNTNLTPPTEPTRQDPYGANDWDILSFGTCSNHPQYSNESLLFHDPHMPSGIEYFGTELNDQRVIRKAGDLLCATGYAITRSGAQKLLLRLSIDLDEPVDLIMCQMAEKEELVAYNVFPRTICQWGYIEGIGGEALSSNIDDHGNGAAAVDETVRKGIWNQVHRERNVWKVRGPNEIKNLALAAVNKYLYKNV